MKQFIVGLFLVVLLPLVVSAQVAGGQIRRPVKKTKMETTKPTKPTSKQNASLTSSAKPTTKKPAQRQPQKSSSKAIIQQLIANMVYVEGGTFTMGATSEQGSDAYDREKPAHQVTLSSFSIGKYEVTQEEWQAVMGSNPSYYKGSKKPVGRVSWEDCQEFISKLNSMTGKRFRLPTEAEWEYAARGGNRCCGYKYAGSNIIGNVAWYNGNSGSKTHDVGQKSPNELGLYDMSGNVSEWCYDGYASYDSSFKNNPAEPPSESSRVHRGGTECSKAEYCRVSYRLVDSADARYDSTGLRLAFNSF